MQAHNWTVLAVISRVSGTASVSIRDSIATAAARGSEVLDLERQGRGCGTLAAQQSVSAGCCSSVQDQNERPPQNLLTSGRRNGVHDTERST